MGQPVDREGNFRAKIIEYELKEFDSGNVSISVKAQLLEHFFDRQWVPWEEYDMEAEGAICIVKSNGTEINKLGAESLIQHAGWDGLFDSVANHTWAPTLCAVAIKQEEYKGKTSLKINFINSYSRTPGASIDPNKVKDLTSRFGSQLRALAGNSGRSTVPTGKPPPAPPPARPMAPAPSQDPNEIPF